MGFSGVVTVTGTPQLALNSGGTASYTSGSGTSTLTFTYTVAAGQNSSPARLHQHHRPDAQRRHDHGHGTNQRRRPDPARPGAAGSLGANKNIVIDTTAARRSRT